MARQPDAPVFKTRMNLPRSLPDYQRVIFRKFLMRLPWIFAPLYLEIRKIRFIFAPAIEPRGAGCSVSNRIAEIAQLVEHNLAKVGVASSSLVFRSKQKSEPKSSLFFALKEDGTSASDPKAPLPGAGGVNNNSRKYPREAGAFSFDVCFSSHKVNEFLRISRMNLRRQGRLR